MDTSTNGEKEKSSHSTYRTVCSFTKYVHFVVNWANMRNCWLPLVTQVLFFLSDTRVHPFTLLFPHHSSYVKSSCLLCILWRHRRLKLVVGFSVRGVWEVGVLLGGGQKGRTLWSQFFHTDSSTVFHGGTGNRSIDQQFLTRSVICGGKGGGTHVTCLRRAGRQFGHHPTPSPQPLIRNQPDFRVTHTHTRRSLAVTED